MNKIAPVKLSKYDPKWVIVFNKEKEKILNKIEKSLLIEHIGSTAIPGSIAKPEIDIMIGIKTLKDSKKYIKPLDKLGYIYFPKFEEFVPERRYFRKSIRVKPLFHIHMVEKGSGFWQDHIIFREYLKSYPEDVKKYNNLKQDLILKFNGDRESYSKGKEKFILDILKIAKKR